MSTPDVVIDRLEDQIKWYDTESALLEGLQQLNQYHQNWITFRSTAEELKHEKFLFLGNAGSYAAASNPTALLAERVEYLVSQENAKWTAAQEQTPKTQKAPGTS